MTETEATKTAKTEPIKGAQELGNPTEVAEKLRAIKDHLFGVQGSTTNNTPEYLEAVIEHLAEKNPPTELMARAFLEHFSIGGVVADNIPNYIQKFEVSADGQRRSQTLVSTEAMQIYDQLRAYFEKVLSETEDR